VASRRHGTTVDTAGNLRPMNRHQDRQTDTDTDTGRDRDRQTDGSYTADSPDD